MPRTRLVWHLFAGWCILVGLVLACCFWLASVQLAALATEAQRQRLGDIGRGVLAAVRASRPSTEPVAFAEQLRAIGSSQGV